MEDIRFNSVSGAYGEFSNFAPFPVELDGKIWPTSEHYFQAQKFAGTKYEERVRQLGSPNAAAKFARTRGLPLRKDWETIRDQVMRRAVRAKFDQHPALAKLLLETENARVVERTHRDDYWGDGGNGKGRNMLGRILMEVRAELRARSESR